MTEAKTDLVKKAQRALKELNTDCISEEQAKRLCDHYDKLLGNYLAAQKENDEGLTGDSGGE